MTTYRKCNPLYGYRWLAEGIKLFLSQPWPWLALTGATLLLLLLLSLLPVLGLVGIFTLFPGIAAGFMFASREASAQRPITFNHLTAGFRTAPRPLLAVGGLAFLVFFLALILITIGWREQFMALLKLAQSQTSDEAALLSAMRELTVPSSLILVVTLLIATATWFTPALVALRRVKVREALVLSYKAVLANFAPFLVYGVLLVLLDMLTSFVLRLLLSALRAGGGEQAATVAAMLVTFPLVCAFLAAMLASAYVSYIDVFETAPKPD